ncbi:AAA family ATPase [Peterkaempfera sp. SMS 1(5)a]|uniref:AAA family ATPase n=1 Tax=Peterkaempfera podocarpi TaxID=3232308 RepID=UPI00367244EA
MLCSSLRTGPTSTNGTGRAAPPGHHAPAPFEQGLYPAEWTGRTYDTLLTRAAALLDMGESVVLDATWTAAEHRRAARLTAQRCTADLAEVHCEVPPELAAARLVTRDDTLSDADSAVADALAVRARSEPWSEATVVDTSGTLERAASRAVAAVRPYGVGQAAPFRRSYLEPD